MASLLRGVGGMRSPRLCLRRRGLPGMSGMAFFRHVGCTVMRVPCLLIGFNGLRALRHQPMLQLARDQPDIGGIGKREPGDDADRHHAPEQKLRRLHRAHVATHHQETHDRRHAGHHEVHRDEFGQEALPHILPIGAAHHRFHEQRLEYEQAEREASQIFDDEIEPHRQAERRGDDGGEDDAGGVAGDAVNGRADALLPERPGECFVLAGTRLLVGKHIKQQTERTHIEGHQDETPLHHHRLGIVSVLVEADI